MASNPASNPASRYEAQAFGLCFSTKEQKDRMRAFVNRRR